MGIFSRIGDVVKSNINDLIDRAEDPEKMVKQIILDLQKEVSNATTALRSEERRVGKECRTRWAADR